MQEALTHLSKDPVLASLITSFLIPENKSSGNLYIDLVRSITGQQLSVKVAQVIYGRLLNLFSGIEPSPTDLSKLNLEDLRAIGYSKQKSQYLLNVAHFFIENPSEYALWQRKEDNTIIQELTSIKGVGRWTAEMVLMFTLERPDIFPVDDYGIQSAMKMHYGLTEEKKPLKNKMLEISLPWRPYRTFACRYLWASLNNEPNS